MITTAQHYDVTWDPAALNSVVQTTGGYPYFIQACGKHVWDVRASNVISASDVAFGVARARDEVDQSLYRSRLDRVSPAQRDFLRAMSLDHDRSSAISDLVARTGKRRTSDLSVSRRELIRAGHIYVPDRGYVAFTVPEWPTTWAGIPTDSRLRLCPSQADQGGETDLQATEHSTGIGRDVCADGRTKTRPAPR